MKKIHHPLNFIKKIRSSLWKKLLINNSIIQYTLKQLEIIVMELWRKTHNFSNCTELLEYVLEFIKKMQLWN